MEPTTKTTTPPLASPFLASPQTPTPANHSFFSRLFKGRVSRKGYFLGFLVTVFPLVLIFIVTILVSISMNSMYGPQFAQVLQMPVGELGQLPPMNPAYESPLYKGIASTIAILILVFLPLYAFYSLSLAVRRFHDVDQSGWLILLSLIPGVGFLVTLFLAFAKGTIGDNKYGNDPSKQTLKQIMGVA